MEEATALKWVKASNGDVPKYAIEGGTVAGETVYIGRAQGYDTSLNPGMIVKSSKTCISTQPKSQTPHFNSSFSFPIQPNLQTQLYNSSYEVLVCPNATDTLDWIETTGDNIPPNALNGGFEKPGEPYYIGRTKLGKGEKNFIIGKVNPRVGELAVYFTDTHTISTFVKYEILVTKEKVEIVEEVLKQTFYDVKYNINARAVKHTTVSCVALANVPINNTSSLPQKMTTSTSLFITETFTWLADNVTKKGPLTQFKCGVPYIPFDDDHDVVSVTPIGILPEQKPKVDQSSSSRVFRCSRNVYPSVSGGTYNVIHYYSSRLFYTL